jgi:predicted hydrolase (HD superfamily)
MMNNCLLAMKVHAKKNNIPEFLNLLSEKDHSKEHLAGISNYADYEWDLKNMDEQKAHTVEILTTCDDSIEFCTVNAYSSHPSYTLHEIAKRMDLDIHCNTFDDWSNTAETAHFSVKDCSIKREEILKKYFVDSYYQEEASKMLMHFFEKYGLTDQVTYRNNKIQEENIQNLMDEFDGSTVLILKDESMKNKTRIISSTDYLEQCLKA